MILSKENIVKIKLNSHEDIPLNKVLYFPK